MDRENGLPYQPDTLQQQPLKKKKNSSWIGFSILLIIINLLFVWLSPLSFLLPLVIIDFIAVRSYIKKQSPPWEAFFISLLAVNVIFFLFAGWTLSQTGGGVAGLLLVFTKVV